MIEEGVLSYCGENALRTDAERIKPARKRRFLLSFSYVLSNLSVNKGFSTLKFSPFLNSTFYSFFSPKLLPTVKYTRSTDPAETFLSNARLSKSPVTLFTFLYP